MNKQHIANHARQAQFFENVIANLQAKQRKHKDALVREARKILEAGGIEQKISEHADAHWTIHVSNPADDETATVWLHASFMYGYEGEAEWRFTYDELARADEIAHWINEREGSRRREKERRIATKELEKAAERLRALDSPRALSCEEGRPR